MLEKLKIAFGKMSLLLQTQFPGDLKKAMLDQAAEIDRLRLEVNELRSSINERK